MKLYAAGSRPVKSGRPKQNTAAMKHQTDEQRRAAIKANLKRGDMSEAARILTIEKRIPTTRNSVLVFLETGRSDLAFHYLNALEVAQVRRLEKHSQPA